MEGRIGKFFLNKYHSVSLAFLLSELGEVGLKRLDCESFPWFCVDSPCCSCFNGAKHLSSG